MNMIGPVALATSGPMPRRFASRLPPRIRRSKLGGPTNVTVACRPTYTPGFAFLVAATGQSAAAGEFDGIAHVLSAHYARIV